MAFRTTVFDDEGNRRYYKLAVVLAPWAVVLGQVHTLFALLGLPLSLGIAYLLCDLTSHMLFNREFNFPSRYKLDTEKEQHRDRWSDYVLSWMCAGICVVIVFAFGEVVDCVRGEDIWKSFDISMKWCK